MHDVYEVKFRIIGRENSMRPDWYEGEVLLGDEVVFSYDAPHAGYATTIADFTNLVEQAFARRLRDLMFNGAVAGDIAYHAFAGDDE